MHNGYFTEDGREFVITDPYTPRPWHNYLFNRTYLANVTQHGTGASFYQPRDEGLRVNVTEDPDGSGGPRHVFLRDNETGRHWSLTGAPDFQPMDSWQCRIGLGYQVNRSELHGIAAEWRQFVPQTDDPCELWTVTVTNTAERARSISVFPYVEMHLTGGSTLMDFISVLGGRYDPDYRAVYGINNCVKFPETFKAVLASDAEVAAATVSRDEFLGHYRDYHNPLAVASKHVHNLEAGTEWLGASLRHDLSIPAGGSVTFNCLLGQMSSVEEGRRMIGTYLKSGEAEGYFAQLAETAERTCRRTTVSTPSPQLNRWMNAWLKHQLRFVCRWGRVIGRGYRDVLQDTFAHRITEPDEARACIKEVFSKQFSSGKCIRAWRLPTAELDLQDYADSPSWMIMALSMYLKETGDFALLDEDVPFLNADDPYVSPTESGTVWEHVLRAQRYLLADRGQHGLCRIRYGDWCDTMNGVGARGEGVSVMLSMQVKWGCDLLTELAGRLGEQDVAAEMNQASDELASAIEADCWDGEYYLRAFDDEGVPVGSDNPPAGDNGEGRIFLNPQSWAMIAGIAPEDRADSAVRAARNRLDTGYGMVLHAPAFTALRPRIGQMTAMTPGFYENGSVYVHGNCFWVHALACSGRGTEAWRAYQAVLPDTDNKPNTDTEPFVIPNYYIGPVVERRKQRNLYLSGWRTGSAAWLYMTALEEILGVRAEYDGLRIDPHLPAGWTKASVTRAFRAEVYEISIENPGGMDTAEVKEVHLDGEEIEGTLVPVVADGGTHSVRVVMG